MDLDFRRDHWMTYIYGNCKLHALFTCYWKMLLILNLGIMQQGQIGLAASE